jgi:nucleotide-binding universal stress UspA family protein
MSFKTILTVTGTTGGDGDIELAASACDEIGAYLAVLVMKLAAPPPIGAYAATVSDAWLEERNADLAALEGRAEQVTAKLAAGRQPGDVSSEYQEVAWGDESIGRRARYADLTILGPELLADGILREKVIEGVLFWSGRPLLLVPQGSRLSLRPKRVIVAWDSGLAASRAVREAIHMLASAEQVHLMLVDPEQGEESHGEEPGADAAVYLARHGASVTVDRLPGQNRPIADTIRRHARDVSADMLVMGAYGHSRLRQRIFGGVTASMLEDPQLPVFMAR